MFLSYPAIFYYNENESASYYVYFPDIKLTGTQGSDIDDAMFMASDYLGVVLADFIENNKILPKVSDINSLSIKDDFPFKDDDELKNYYNFNNSFKSMVLVDVSKYLDSQKLVKKTLTIPKWVNDIGVKQNINFSKLLTDSIVNKVKFIN